ncbi:DUF1801 domain-containing protein [Flavobacterium nackdongense]|uniref:DUF1801 domain-containing protein n=1 Tax=Flavobacterium nackdongense TaxID=2547394 RepID=A0A4P6YD66_9FLAO|nr:DUF1801 domain-containing protein [Flavobacterium nackdongense]QBN18293.1 DUF1801 domain-containing protein [Flavobacterium nackdongense]
MDKVNQWALELDLLKTIIAKKELTETIKWGSNVYVHNGKNIVGIAGFKNFFTIWFFNGAKLTDQKKVLINAQEGVTKSMRQWRFRSKDEIDEETILQYLEEAMQL